MIEAFAAALVATAAAQAAPGPNFVAVAAAALGQGRRAGLWVTIGVTSGVLVWVSAVALGLGVVLELFPALVTAMKIIGGGYLLYIAVKAARALFDTRSDGTVAAKSRMASDFENWRLGILVVLTNPKAGLMWIAIASFLFGQHLNVSEVLAFAPVGALSAFAIYGCYALLFSTNMATSVYQKFQRIFEAAFAATFGAMGAALMLSGLREIHR
jgi:threonine efflux protein